MIPDAAAKTVAATTQMRTTEMEVGSSTMDAVEVGVGGSGMVRVAGGGGDTIRTGG